MRHQHISSARRSQLGVNLIELMIGIVLGLFVLLGMIRVFDNTRIALTAQTGVASLQEKQRLGVSLISGVIQTAGYIPGGMAGSTASPADLRDANFAVRAGSYPVGASIFGTNNTFNVRYVWSQPDGVLDCQGRTNTTGNPNQIITNNYSVNTVNNTLDCSTGADGVAPPATVALLQGVSAMNVQYGITLKPSGLKVYLPASAMTATTWPRVNALRITLTYQNPLYPQPGQAETTSLTQVIRVMGYTS